MVPFTVPPESVSLTAAPITTGGVDTVVESFVQEEKRLQAIITTALNEKKFVFILCFDLFI